MHRIIALSGMALAIALAGCEMPTDTPKKQDPNKPSFGNQRVETQRYVAGVAIPNLVLPRATGGDGTLNYRLTPVPQGMSFDARARTLSGVPAKAVGYRLNYRVEDADGDADELSFRVEAEPRTTIYRPFGGIQRAGIDDGVVEDLLTSGLGISSVVVGRHSAEPAVYWSEFDQNSGSGWIRRANLDGSDRVDIVTTTAQVGGIALDLENEKLYWTEGIFFLTGREWLSFVAKVRRANLDGSGAEDIIVQIQDTVLIFGIALDLTNEKLYWTEFGSGGSGSRIRRANLDGSETEVIVESSASVAWGVALDVGNGKLYWTENEAGTSGKLRRANLDGSGEEDIVEKAAAQFGGIALDLADKRLYWAEFGGGYASIKRANLDGSGEENFVTRASWAIWGIALDRQQADLYLAESNDFGSGLVRVDVETKRAEDVVRNRSRAPIDGLALDVISGTMYWAEVDSIDMSGEVGAVTMRSADLDGSVEKQLFTISAEPYQIEFDVVERMLYWIERTEDQSRIMRANPDGSGMSELATVSGHHRDIEIDTVDRKLYWIDQVQDGEVIRRANLDGTAKEIVDVHHLYGSRSLAIDIVGRKLYWYGHAEPLPPPDDTTEPTVGDRFTGDGVYRANLDGSGKETVMEIDSGGRDLYIVIDGSDEKMYYSRQDEEDAVVISRANLDGSGVEEIVTTRGWTVAFALGIR